MWRDVDFVLGASQTTERKEFAYFSEPYRQELFQLYVRKNDADLPVADLKSFLTAGHKVGIVNEYYYGDEVAELFVLVDNHRKVVCLENIFISCFKMFEIELVSEHFDFVIGPSDQVRFPLG